MVVSSLLLPIPSLPPPPPFPPISMLCYRGITSTSKSLRKTALKMWERGILVLFLEKCILANMFFPSLQTQADQNWYKLEIDWNMFDTVSGILKDLSRVYNTLL